MTPITPKLVREWLDALKGWSGNGCEINGVYFPYVGGLGAHEQGNDSSVNYNLGIEITHLAKAYLEAVEFIAIQHADQQALKIKNLDKIGASYTWDNLNEACKEEYRAWAKKQLALTRMEEPK